MRQGQANQNRSHYHHLLRNRVEPALSYLESKCGEHTRIEGTGRAVDPSATTADAQLRHGRPPCIARQAAVHPAGGADASRRRGSCAAAGPRWRSNRMQMAEIAANARQWIEFKTIERSECQRRRGQVAARALTPRTAPSSRVGQSTGGIGHVAEL